MSSCIHRLFGISIWDETLKDATRAILEAAQSGERRTVYFVNAHCINVAVRNPDYLDALKKVDRAYADGSGLAIAARLAGSPLRDNVNGTDMFPLLCEYAARENIPIALLGAKPGIAVRCAENMKARFQGLQFSFVEHGYFDRSEEAEMIQRLNASGAKILLVAFGVPFQELWIQRNAAILKAPVLLAVGGLFDFYSGLRVRAPLLLRKTGFEWVYRLAQEPMRMFVRYVIGNPLYLSRIFFLRLKGKKYLMESIFYSNKS